MAAEQTPKTCRICHQQLPVEAFRQENRDGKRGYDNRCKPCYAAYMREYRLAKREGRINEFAAALKWSRDPDRVQRLCDRVFAEFGGTDKFATAWVDYIQSGIAAKKPSKPIFDSFQAILRLVEVCERR